MKPPLPLHLIPELDRSFDHDRQLSPELIREVADWVEMVVAYNVDKDIKMSIDEMILIASALNSALGAPISSIPEAVACDERNPSHYVDGKHRPIEAKK